MRLVVEAIDCKVTYITIFVGIKARRVANLTLVHEGGILRVLAAAGPAAIDDKTATVI